MEMTKSILEVAIPIVMTILIFIIIYNLKLYVKYWKMDKQKIAKLKDLDYQIANSTDYKEIVSLTNEYNRIKNED
jgi:hypothetical protein